MTNWTPRQWLYLLCALAGAIVPWYFNLQQLRYGAEPFTVANFIGAGLATPMAASITTDFFFTALAVSVFMLAEARRLRMRRVWLYFVLAFTVALACAAPLFLFFRERQLAAGRT